MKSIWLFLAIGIFLIGSVSAMTIFPMKYFEKLEGQQYGQVQIKNFLGIGGDLIKVELKKNTNFCLINCSAEGTAEVFQETNLFSNTYFENLDNGKNEKISYKIYIQRGTIGGEEIVNSCSEMRVYNSFNKTYEIKEDCFPKKIKVQVPNWVSYNGEILKVGNYSWRLEGKKGVQDNIDWIGEFSGVKVNEWATWNSSFENGLVRVFGLENNVEGINGKYNLTEMGGSIEKVSGIYYNASSFSTLGKYFNSSDNTNIPFGANSRSISLWINKNQTGAGAPFFMGEQTSSSGFYLIINTADKLCVGQWGGGDPCGSTTITNNTWHHLVITYDGVTATSYLDGIQQSQRTITYTSGGIFSLGNIVNIDYFRGSIDELYVYNRLLAPNEITDLYNGGTGIFPTFVIPDNPPVVTLTSPINYYNSSINNINFNCSASDDNKIMNISLWINGQRNYTVINGLTNFSELDISKTFPNGNYNWTCSADDNSTITITTFASTNRTITINPIIINSVNYNPSSISTSNESFSINLNYSSSQWINAQANLIYNGNYFSSIKLGSGDNISFSNNFNIPNSLTIINYTFYWNIALTNYSGTFYFNSSQYQQTINPIQNISIITGGSACPAGFSQSLYFNFADEENLTYLNSSGSYNIKYGIGNNSALILAGTYSNVNSISFCMNSSFSYYSLGHGEINYGANGYINRFFYLFENSRITNQTINNTLYLLPNTATTTSFLFDFQDSTLFPLSERYATLMRWYPGFNEYRVVEMGKTDDKGETIMRVKSEDTDYRVGIYYLNGTLVKLLNPIRFACLSSPCTYSTIVQDTNTNYINYFNVQTGLTYNETTHIWSFIWNDPSQDTKSMRLVVSRERGDSSYVICNNTASGFTGILTCDSSGYTGNLEAIAYRTASPEVPIAQLLITTGSTPLSNSVGLFVSLIIFLLLALIGIWSPVASIVLGLVALIPAYFFGTITLPILIAIGVLAGIIIHFMKRTG